MSKKPSPEAKAAGMEKRGHKDWKPEDDEQLLMLARTPGMQNWRIARKFAVGVEVVRSRLSLLIRKEIAEADIKPSTYRVSGVTLQRYSIQDKVKLPSDGREDTLTS